MYEEAFKLFNNVMDYFPKEFVGTVPYERYYRLRPGIDFECEKNQMFHIPINIRKNVGQARYSVPGYPCLYLASQPELCWYECDKPRKFTRSHMKVPQTKGNHLKVIDFTQKMGPLQHAFYCWLINNSNDTNEIETYLYKHLVIYPIRVACSISVPMAEKKKPFKEEYIIPQLLMQWIRQNGKYDGIKYQSATAADKDVNCLGGHDLILPSVEFREDGLCKVLAGKIGVATPKRYDIDTICVPDYLKDISKDITEEPFYWSMETLADDFSVI